MSDRRIERTTTQALALALTSELLLSGCEALVEVFVKVVLVGLAILASRGRCSSSASACSCPTATHR